jgi:hypothetical protein
MASQRLLRRKAMNFNSWQGKRARMALWTLAVMAGVVFAGAALPAQAQTLPVAFPAPTTFTSSLASSNSTVSVATGDFNGDGKLDVLGLDYTGNLNVVLGKGNGTFQTPIVTNLAMSNIFYDAIAAGDFNGDHLLDVAVWAVNATTGNTEVHILLGNGSGNFTISGTYAAPSSSTFTPGPDSIVAADLNGDGKLDLVGATPFNGVYVFLGNGDGTFKSAVNYSAGTTSGGASGIAVGDLNSDGKLDLAVSTNDGISILLNTGSGAFGAAAYYPSGVANSVVGDGIAIGDLNGDKKPDVVVTNENFGAIIFLNQGGGVFTESGTINGVPMLATDNVVLADINNDKKLDIILVDGGGNVFTFYGKGTGVFSSGPAYPLQAPSFGGNSTVAVGDFNGDGALDLLETNGEATNTVSLGRGDGTFQTNQLYAYTATLVANNIVTADFNGDGFPDIAQSLSGGANGKIGINLGSSHGVLGAASLVTASTCVNNAVQWVATGDVNGDGKADIVATMQDASFAGCQNNTVAVLIGQGTGKFKPAVYYPTSSTAQEQQVYLVDVNGDGKLDIVTENADGTISVLLNKGNGTYKAGTLVTGLSTIYPHSVYLTFADFNGDGKMDIGAEGSQTEVYVLLGTGTGTFGAPIQTVTPYYPITLAAADFNRDGKMDLLVTTTANGCINNDRGYAFLKGLGNGTFTPGSINCLPYQSPEIPIVADLNGDGKLDVVIPYYGGIPTGPVVLQGKGDGTFTSIETFYSGTAVMSAAVADFNGDGTPDIALVNGVVFSPSFLSVMFNSTQPVSVSPLTVNYGSVTVASKKPATVILTNNQNKALAITSIALGGTDPGDFSETSNCGTSRKARADCTITVTFTPTLTGSRTATLSIVDAVGTQTVQLNGTGQ